MLRAALWVLLLLSAVGLPPGEAANAVKPGATFEKTVQPVLAKNCAACHNERITSGGLDLASYLKPGSIATHRDEWRKILQKMRTGEMPPRGVRRPTVAQIDAVVRFVQAEFDKADRNTRPDTGATTTPPHLDRNE